MSAKTNKSETVRRKGRIRRFVAPIPDTTLSHLVKMAGSFKAKIISCGSFCHFEKQENLASRSH
jgi:hypothetical protein